MENLIYVVLLIIHNIALVGCAAAPFYNLRLVNQRAQFGQKLFYQLDKVVEDAIQGLEPYCWTFFVLLFVTGFGFPITYYLFHGEFKKVEAIVILALVLKHIFVLGMFVIAIIISTSINPRIRDVFARFSPDTSPDEEAVKQFFAFRARRKKLCKICLVFAILILVITPVLRFY
jgi:hypothetical protein